MSRPGQDSTRLRIIPGLSGVVCKAFGIYPERCVACAAATFYDYADERSLLNIKACLLAEGMAVSEDSDLEAFSRNPTDGSFAVLGNRYSNAIQADGGAPLVFQ